MLKSFLGYHRPDGSVGIRNHVLILSATRTVRLLTETIAKSVCGVKTFTSSDEDGKSEADRKTISRVLIGLASNPNIASVLLVCNKADAGYPELCPTFLRDSILRTGKKVVLLSIEDEGGFYNALGSGIRIARELVREASAITREKADIGKLSVAVKCGLSDATSGISGNPVLGRALDNIISAGGTAIFSETTEVIGAEEILAKRFVHRDEAAKFLDRVHDTELEARRIGEDIRTINPIPANIEAGISTLEEKSLGAMAKTGGSPIQGVLDYGERPRGKGLYFMDSWMSSTSLLLGYAAAGAHLTVFQLGGGALPKGSPIPSQATAVAAPVYYMTGNPRTHGNIPDEVDFNAGGIIQGEKTLLECCDNLLQDFVKIASGKMTRAETWRYDDSMEIYLTGPNL